MNFLSVKELSKSYGDQPLFSNISFGLERGDKMALIAKNGTGKSTLLKIIAGKESPDEGEVVIRNGLKVGYLPQEPGFDDEMTVSEIVFGQGSELLSTIREYEEALELNAQFQTGETLKRLEEASLNMDAKKAWDYERRLKELLTKFNVKETDKKIKTLSGGQRKRLSLALTLLDEPDLLLLDEPTNHLDIEMIEWLERYLQQTSVTLLMVTHDRYFLDRVCNHILELTDTELYHYDGNYAYFLKKKAEREELLSVEVDKAKKLMKKELEWIRRQPKARTTKSKARIDAFEEVKKKAFSLKTEKELKLEVTAQRLGGKILELRGVSKRFGEKEVIRSFDYTFKKGERIGIVGKNGSGKSTFLNLITGNLKPDEGTVTVGETVVFGYYRQEGLPVYREDQKVIEVVKDIAEVVEVGKNKFLTASQFLDYFLFPPSKQNDWVINLSGGEKRRLFLLTVLIKNPNFLILDEPTNDLDLLTLYKLEEFLLQYQGCLLLVSHDRYFLDKLSDHLFIFEEHGRIKDFYGSYQDYQKKKWEAAKQKDKEEKELKTLKEVKNKPKKKLSFKEQKEYENLEREIEALEIEKKNLEDRLNSGITDYEELTKISQAIERIMEAMDEKTMRWMELEELKESLRKQ